MPLTKEQKIAELQASFSRCSIAVVTNYQGLTVSQITDLRRKLRKAAVEYAVVKNTLALLAAQRAGKDALGPVFEGPSAIAFGFGDAAVPAKELMDFAQTTRLPLTIKGGIISSRFLSPDDLKALCNLPSREVLLAQVVRGISMPLVSLVSVPASILRGLVNVLEARRKQITAS